MSGPNWLLVLAVWCLPRGVVLADSEMVALPAGVFLMGSTEGEPDERPPHQVSMAAFQIDRFEVTQNQYASCVAAKVCAKPIKVDGPLGAGLPVVGVTWYDAMKYCTWAGKRLPTEAEWERAARGTDGRRFPWGEQALCSNANFGNFEGSGFCAEENPGRILVVGSRPQGSSSAGVQDLAGNVWEWVSDIHRPYPWKQQPQRPLPRSKQTVHQWRVIRGGSCCSYFAMPTTTNRLSFPADYADFDIGFRCAH